MSFDPNNRLSFVELRKRLQNYIHEEYYLALDETYEDFNLTTKLPKLDNNTGDSMLKFNATRRFSDTSHPSFIVQPQSFVRSSSLPYIL